MATLAERYLGQPVAQTRFQDVPREDEFGSIWACASLLHVPKNELPQVFGRLGRALKPGGVRYASFKLAKGSVRTPLPGVTSPT